MKFKRPRITSTPTHTQIGVPTLHDSKTYCVATIINTAKRQINGTK